MKHAGQFLDDFVAKGGHHVIMWRTSCRCSVSRLKKSHGKNHLGSASHKYAKLNAGKLNKQPSLGAPVESPPQPQTSPQHSTSTSSSTVNSEALKVVQVQCDVKDILTRLNHNPAREKLLAVIKAEVCLPLQIFENGFGFAILGYMV